MFRFILALFVIAFGIACFYVTWFEIAPFYEQEQLQYAPIVVRIGAVLSLIYVICVGAKITLED